MILAVYVWGAVSALAGEIEVNAMVHDHPTRVVLDAAAVCSEQELVYDDENGSWEIRVEGGEIEGGDVWLKVGVAHRWRVDEERREIRVNPTFITQDGELASLSVGENIVVDIRATNMRHDAFSCVPEQVARSHREVRRARVSRGGRD